MAALWVKEQSGGRTKIVLIGKPKACFDEFDLILAAAHYQLPDGRKKVLRIGLPLIFIPPHRLQDARQAWSARLAGLQRPITVLCFGGSTGARPLDLDTVRQIIFAARKTASSGTLYVLTSRRTPASVYAEIKAQLPHNGMFYGWKDKDSENPYVGLLALGDRFIVTGDSISMLVEVVRLGKPLAIAALPPEGGLMGLARRILLRFGGGASRDFDLLHRHLYDRGWAVPLGREFITPQTPPPDDSERAAERIRQLLFSG
jgi:mitochondrial fission protein ELM1